MAAGRAAKSHICQEHIGIQCIDNLICLKVSK